MDSLTFFNLLREINAVSEVWKYVLIMLKNQYDASEDVLNLFCLFFSLIDDGNTCISLDPDNLKCKWQKKILGLGQEYKDVYDDVIEKGLRAVAIHAKSDGHLICEYISSDAPVNTNSMFVIYKGWLFIEKFFAAKRDVEDGINTLFPINANAGNISAQDVKKIQEKYSKMIPLTEEQARAILRAKEQNLIITGGPGTGKTTVIFYLLLELLSQNKNHKIYMAAPSGKAAQRMKESITQSLSKVQDGIVKEIISTIQPVTIHKLLGLSGVNTRERKKFQANSIFVIDESSMIDIELFAKLLNVIKQSDNVRVFILGDKDQLPSVQPGAVFCDLTEKRSDCLVELTKTKRFDEQSEIYKLKEQIRQHDSSAVSANWDAKLEFMGADGKGRVKYMTISDKEETQKTVINWYNNFYNNEKYEKVYSNIDTTSADIMDVLNDIWNYIENAKILCAENNGIRGTIGINKVICGYITTKYAVGAVGDLFAGEQIIVTQNQNLYDLRNGDIGIIVLLDGKKYMMIKRKNGVNDAGNNRNSVTQDRIFRIGDYIFYPLYLLPTDAIEPAYAITIHKSQGSEYDNILIFLPDSINSPLLSCQILYTAVTRTKYSTYIVSASDNMAKAIEEPEERDTQLFL